MMSSKHMCKPHYSSNLNPITDFDLTWPTWSGIVCNKALKPTPSQPPPEPHIYPQNLAEGLGACRVRGHEVPSLLRSQCRGPSAWAQPGLPSTPTSSPGPGAPQEVSGQHQCLGPLLHLNLHPDRRPLLSVITSGAVLSINHAFRGSPTGDTLNKKSQCPDSPGDQTTEHT